MKITAKQYAQALFLDLKDKKREDFANVIEKFLLVLKNDNCFSKVEKIIFYFNDFWNKEKSLIEAEIISAHVLEKNIKEEIFSYIRNVSQAKDVIINEKKKEEIKGGFIAKYGDKIFDASIKNRLNIFKNNLNQ